MDKNCVVRTDELMLRILYQMEVFLLTIQAWAKDRTLIGQFVNVDFNVYRGADQGRNVSTLQGVTVFNLLLISDGRITIARRAELLPAHAEPTRAAPGRPVQRDHNQQNHRPNRQASHCETMRAQSIGKWLLCNPLTTMRLF